MKPMRRAGILGAASLAAMLLQAQPVAELLAEGERLQRSADRSEQRLALARFRAAAESARTQGDPALEERALYRWGQTHLFLGEAREAIPHLEAALRLARSRQDARAQAFSAHNLGTAYWSVAEPHRALELFEQALKVRRQLGDRTGEAYTLAGIANCAWTMGDAAEALAGYREALDLWRALGDAGGEADTHNSLGVVYTLLGDWERARVEFDAALQLRTDARLRAYTFSNLAWLEVGRRDYPAALSHAGQALPVFEETGDRRAFSYALHNAASARAGLRQHRVAVSLYEQAEALRRDVGDRWAEAYSLQAAGDSLLALGELREAANRLGASLRLRRDLGDRSGEVFSLASLARLNAARRNWPEAGRLMTAAIGLIEEQRVALTSLDLRESYFATAREYYRFLEQMLVRAGNWRGALETFERARGRLLLDRIGDRLGDWRAPEPLRAGQRRLDARINSLASQLERLGAAGGGAETLAARARLSELLIERRDLMESIRAAHPGRLAWSDPRPVGLGGIQSLLDPGTVFLAVSASPEQTHMWLVTSNGAHFRQTAALAAPGDWLEPDRLSRTAALLLDPWKDSIRKARRIVVSAGEPLESLPWSALPWDGRPLVEHCEVVLLPSAAALELARHTGGRRAPPPRRLLLFADPVYSAEDPRSAGLSAAAPARYRRLRFSRQEAEAIAQLTGREAAHIALDWDASRESLNRLRPGDFEILHFAAHAATDAARPEVMGIALSQIDRQGKPVDGFVRLREILDWDLRARLVVLSACSSAAGAPGAGEGLASLGRAFLHAGARTVAGTLWNVDDRATAQLMKRFYEELLAGGVGPSGALRAAQRSIRATPGWEHPRFWAAFVLMGEWR